MRLGVVWEGNSNAHYRAIMPLREMERRGHQVVWPADRKSGEPDLRRLAGCELVHVYRRYDRETRRVLAELARGGTAISWDNDDDLGALPKGSPNYGRAGALAAQRTFTATVRVARAAHAVTTPSEVLAKRYRAAGVEDVEVIGNYLAAGAERPRRSHDGLVVGWVAGHEHQVDAERLRIRDALRGMMARDERARVECVGVDVGLSGERYRHDPNIHFLHLPERMATFDVGIAPLADLPFNRARSDVKLKEYAASGVPWLASPVGPYAGLGERQGGLLVPDGGWEEALVELLAGRWRRFLLSRRGRRWAKGQTVDRVADRWERAFREAIGRARGSGDRPGRAVRRT